MITDKIGAQHRERKAVLYVRQSSAHQVLHNRESQALQYAMRERLTELGWSEIEIIDEDLGLSAAGGTTRAGFERMVAEVCLGKVGAVAARATASARISLASPLPAFYHLTARQPTCTFSLAPSSSIPLQCRWSTFDGRNVLRTASAADQCQQAPSTGPPEITAGPLRPFPFVGLAGHRGRGYLAEPDQCGMFTDIGIM